MAYKLITVVASIGIGIISYIIYKYKQGSCDKFSNFSKDRNILVEESDNKFSSKISLEPSLSNDEEMLKARDISSSWVIDSTGETGLQAAQESSVFGLQSEITKNHWDDNGDIVFVEQDAAWPADLSDLNEPTRKSQLSSSCSLGESYTIEDSTNDAFSSANFQLPSTSHLLTGSTGAINDDSANAINNVVIGNPQDNDRVTDTARPANNSLFSYESIQQENSVDYSNNDDDITSINIANQTCNFIGISPETNSALNDNIKSSEDLLNYEVSNKESISDQENDVSLLSDESNEFNQEQIIGSNKNYNVSNNDAKE